MSARVYLYKCKRPTEGAELLEEQLRLASEFRAELVELERWRRALTDGLLAPLREARLADAKARGLERPKGRLVIPPDVQEELWALDGRPARKEPGSKRVPGQHDELRQEVLTRYADAGLYWG